MAKKDKSITKTGEIRAEEYMKSMLEKAEPLSLSKIKNQILLYLNGLTDKVEYFILHSREVDYYQVFHNKNGLSNEILANQITDFLSESFFTDKDGNIKSLSEVVEIENSADIEPLDVWIRTTYFQLAPFDWGVEVIIDKYEGVEYE